MRPIKKDRGRKRSSMHSFKLWLHSINTRCMLVVFAGMLVLMAMLCASSAPKRYSLKVGSISHQTITANKDVIDEITTEERRAAAAAAVEPTYQYVQGGSESVMATLSTVLSELRTVQQYGLTLRAEGETGEDLRFRTFSEAELEYARSLVKSMPVTNYQLTTLLRTDTQTFEEMASSVTTAVSAVLNTTIREGQVTEAIQTILQIVGYKVETSLFQNILPTVLRTSIAPNMIIEQTGTELARQAARDSVEPVVYLQGQNIIREGERVSKYQYEMLRSLGLLENNQQDLTMYAGTVLMIVVAIVLLLLMLRQMAPDVLHDLRRISVVVTVLCVCAGVNIITSKLLHVYVAPVATGVMLLTSLLGAHVGVAGLLCVTTLVSCMAMGSSVQTADMIHLLMMTLVGGGVSSFYLKRRPQRVHVLLCGLWVALINVVLLFVMSMLTTSSLTPALDDIAWCMAGGLISGVLAASLQPILETIFNLATPSKLLELGNPNQPLLRRLLLEAPGTYHHSIVVANLSEAAAEKIGANPLLARTGAYFHDVGKLKRPLYFKENQMGENPHDHTDPYVSAAIVTTHTRDGLAFAQKHRLPLEIQRIIVEHHGDTPVMFFYHKALQQSNGKTVDIADFRYDGNRPATKESAIVMLADTVEAAVRSMPDPTPQAIERFIEKLVRGKLEDGQLSYSPLTLQDIDGICEAFANVLSGVFHERIEYPTVNVPKRDIFTGGLNATEKEAAEAEAAENAKRQEAPAAPAKASESQPAAPAKAAETTEAASAATTEDENTPAAKDAAEETVAATEEKKEAEE